VKGQLDLMGGEVTAADELTPRQRAVYELVLSTEGGITADEAGAVAHEQREKRPHHRDERCLYCGEDGRQILHALRAKGFVRGRRNPRGGMLYVPAQAAAQAEAVDAIRPDFDGIPF
jgi:hypothetical protein